MAEPRSLSQEAFRAPRDIFPGLSLRHPPQNIQAEQGLLGALLASNAAYAKVADFLEPRHFADPLHGQIYGRIAERILGGRIANAVAMKLDFEVDPFPGMLISVDTYLADLLISNPGIIVVSEYGRAILDAWQRRRLVEIGEAVVNNAFGADPGLDADGQIQAAEQSIASLRQVGQRGDRMSSAGSLVSGAIAQAEAVYQGVPSRRVMTGMPTIDQAIRLLPGTLTLLAGPPGSGKTALATQIGKSIAKRLYADRPSFNQPGVAIFSLEMSGEELGERILAHEAEIALDHLQDGRLDDATVENLMRAETALRHVPLRIWDCTETPLRMIPRKIRLHLSNRPESLVIVDHLHVDGADGDKGRQGENPSVNQLAGAFKTLARAMDIPIILLAHMSRPPKGVEVRRPTLFDVKYGGESAADIVMFPHRPIMFMDTKPPVMKAKETDDEFRGPNGTFTRWHNALEGARDLAEIVVVKQRSGRPGVYRMRFHGSTTSFSEWSTELDVDDPQWEE
jgi:replicative DNA helicase